ncbi:MAG: threonine/serine exporter family protein [Gemmatimonadota bacterium]
MSNPALSLTSIYMAPAATGVASEEGTVRFLRLATRAYAAVDEVPARIEDGVTLLANSLGFEADCNATATAVFLTLSHGDRQWTEVIRVQLGGPDYARAVALHRLLSRVASGELTPDDGANRLAELLRWRRKRSVLLTMSAAAMLSASAALLLRAQLTELLLAIGLGALVGLALTFVGPRRHLEPLAPVAMAAIAAFVAFSSDGWGVASVRPVPLLIAALVIFLPGWRMTVAMTELAQGHWTSGAGRFLAAITTLLLLIVGVVVGQQAARSSEEIVMTSAASLPGWVRVLSPLLAGLAMTELFSARRRDALSITLICVLASLASYLGGRLLGSTASAYVGAFTAMALGALLAARQSLPYPVLQQPATVLLVPGSIGFLSLGSLVGRDVSNAVQTGFQMLFVALTLALGAMTAQVVLRPLTERRRA